MRKLAALFVLLCLAALLWTLWSGSEGPVAPEAPPPVPDAGPAEPLPVENTPEPVPEPPPDEPAVHPAHRPPTNLPFFGPPPPKGPKVTVTGTVVVAEKDGTERSDLDGVLSYMFWKENRGWGRVVRISKGHFTIEVPEGTQLEFGNLELGGEEAALRPECRLKFPVEPDGSIALAATRVEPTRLRVLAADTGSPLPNVEIVYGHNWSGSPCVHPVDWKNHGARRTTGAPPLPLPRPKYHEAGRPTQYHVRAPGYAWGRIALDPTAGGERLIRLIPAGDLLVRIGPAKLDKGTFLRLRKQHSTAVHFEAAVKGRSEIPVDSLPAGTFLVSLEVGRAWDDPAVLAQARVEITAGATAEVFLEPEELAPVERVPMAGVLVVPPEWETDRVTMRFELLDPARHGPSDGVRQVGALLIPRPGRKGVFHFDAGPRQPGRYRVRIEEIAWLAGLDLPEEGATDLRLTVPAPAQVSVWVLAEDTGEETKIEGVHWHVAWPKESSGGTLENARWNPETKRFEFRAPQGRVEISSADDDYRHASATVEVTEGVNRVDLRVRRACGLVIRLQDGQATVAWVWKWKVRLENLVGDGYACSSSSPGGAHRIGVSKPGTYRVSFPKIEGFRAIPDREVTIRPGEFADVTVELERED